MRILHLCHDLMNLYGDYANVCALERLLAKNGVEVVTDRLSVGDEIDFSQYGFIYIGSGTEKNQKTALEFLKPCAEELRKALENNAVILATGNSWELFGKEITDSDGRKYEGLGLFSYRTEETRERVVEDTVCGCSLCGGDIVGFINKCSEISGVDSALFEVKRGSSNRAGENAEGFVSGGFFGTHLIGPLLIKNPAFAHMLVNKITEK